jgi:sulfur carrier protein
MEIILNDKPCIVEENISLADFVKSLSLKPEGIAIAIDCEVVPKNEWANIILKEKMELILIHAVSGG